MAVNTKEMAPSAPVEESSEPTTNLSTPYPITLRLLALNNVKVTVDDTAISLAEFRTGAQWQERALTLMPTKIGSLLIALPKTPQNPLPEAVQPAVEVAKRSASRLPTRRSRHLSRKRSRWAKR